ncbi:hypothetical protein [Streptomyces olivochromogenes]|uniref:hypothetical protein n=1 Tax=Streptomyces olivochromogenes TaxID=1963 RepID=UPI001F1B480F|nr:hypothetical protein [Streptomyces olivochromogenes]MCF3136827.1 hypothetical protein [Streptomyces olivochromogenes]
MTEPNPFENMNRAGFRAYVRTQYEKNGKPKYQVIIDQAREHDPNVKLTTSTISDALRKNGFPRLPTAQALGLGLGGPELSEDFARAWHAAWENHRREAHDASMEAAERAQAQEESRTRFGTHLGSRRFPSGWPLLGDRRVIDALFILVFLASTTLAMLSAFHMI